MWELSRQNNGNQVNSMDFAEITREIESLVSGTFSLWDGGWVEFSWPAYYFNHTKRVEALSLAIGAEEGADQDTLRLAALLHDVTKRYDGQILKDASGNRILDEYGFWKNEICRPNGDGGNFVTDRYDSLDLYGTLHSLSGEAIARELLARHGLPPALCAEVGTVIRAHVKPTQHDENLYAAAGSRALYDADTIDANVGLVAFFRNIHIRAHYAALKGEKLDLREYVDTIPPWLTMKRDFLPKLMTETGLRIAEGRLQRVHDLHAELRGEREDYALNIEYGLLGMLAYFAENNELPDMVEQLRHLREVWLPRRRAEVGRRPGRQAALDRVGVFIGDLDAEARAIA